MNRSSITIHQLPRTSLMGVMIRTNMEKTVQDCPRLWQNFMKEFQSSGMPMTLEFAAFGVSANYDCSNGSFDYWVAVPACSGAPESWKQVIVPGGAYGMLTVPTVQHLRDAYDIFYTQWLGAQSEYVLDDSGMSFEKYDDRYNKTGELELYVPVRKK